MDNTCSWCDGEFVNNRCPSCGERNEVAIRQEMTNKLDRIFVLLNNCESVRIYSDRAHLQFNQYDKYGISVIDTVDHVSVSNGKINFWGYIKRYLKDNQWQFVVLEVYDAESISGREIAKELIALCGEVFLRTDSDRGYSLTVTNEGNNIYSFEIPRIKCEYASSNWFEWCD